MSNKLSAKVLTDAIEKSLYDFGAPDVLYVDPMTMSGLYKQLVFHDSNTSQTAAKVRHYFHGQANPSLEDYNIMSKAVKAFGHLGLDKDEQKEE